MIMKRQQTENAEVAMHGEELWPLPARWRGERTQRAQRPAPEPQSTQHLSGGEQKGQRQQQPGPQVNLVQRAPNARARSLAHV
jgi:hypothetical protein